MDVYSFINEYFDWTSYVTEQYDFKEARRGQELRICCPANDCGDINYKMYVNIDRGKFHCFKCGRSSNQDCPAVDFVQLCEEVSYKAAVDRIMADLSITAPEYEDLEKQWNDDVSPSEKKSVIRYIDGMPSQSMKLTNFRNPIEKPFFRYLADRGLTYDEIVDMQVHAVPKYDCWLLDDEGKKLGNIGKRVLWPIYGGSPPGLVSWDGRTTKKDDIVKYMKCPDADHALTLWPYVPPPSDEVVIVEGILDAYAVRRVPGVASYATFTKHISEAQMALLRRWGVKRVTLFWDKSDAKKQMVKAVEDLKMHFSTAVACQTGLTVEEDCGDTLRMPNGVDVLRRALRPIESDSMEYMIWKTM